MDLKSKEVDSLLRAMACNIQYLNNYPNPGHPGNTLMNLTRAERHVLFTLVMKRISDNAVGEPFELPPLPKAATPQGVVNGVVWTLIVLGLFSAVAVIVEHVRADRRLSELQTKLAETQAELTEARKIQWVPVTPRKKEP